MTFTPGSSGFTVTGGTYYEPLNNQELKEYLKEGPNEIVITAVYSNRGFVQTEFEARQQCCTKLNDKWEKRCWVE
jgi:hypothetical protein